MSEREILRFYKICAYKRNKRKHEYCIGPSDLPTALVSEQGELNDLMQGSHKYW